MTRRVLLACALVGLSFQLGAPALAEPLTTVTAPLRLVANGPVATRVSGLHRYLGSVEIDAAPDGLVVVNRVGLERYLLGLNEVPPDWPAAALEAQAIAARTYALWSLLQPRAGAAEAYGFDICASTDCQVFAGADVLRVPNGRRWEAAVEATRARALIHDGQPILARYHSVSGGHTLDNSEAFSGEPDYPYLQGVVSDTESASPLYRWKVRFGLDELRSLIEEAGWWAGGRLTEVHTIPSRADLHYPDVVFEGLQDRVVKSAQEVREVVGALAARGFPSRYPSAAPTATGRLPETFPSNRFEVETGNGVAVVHGRGWGHGVGMSQWGAYGMARRGQSTEDILTHYYTGARLETVEEPRRVRVGVAWGLDTVRTTGSFRVVDGAGRSVIGRALGTWTISHEGTGLVSIAPPAGFARPLTLEVVRAPRTLAPGKRGRIAVRLSAPAEVRTTSEGFSRAVVLEAGRRHLTWRAPEEPGTYRVEVSARGRSGRRRTKAVDIRVAGRAPVGRESGRPEEQSAWVGIVLGAAAIAIGAASLIRPSRA